MNLLESTPVYVTGVSAMFNDWIRVSKIQARNITFGGFSGLSLPYNIFAYLRCNQKGLLKTPTAPIVEKAQQLI